MLETPLIKRLFKRVSQKENGCWVWTGYRDARGNGRINFKSKPITVRRASWLIFFGPLTDDDEVTSTCQNKCCVNPFHLKLLDPRYPRSKEETARGTQHAAAKLTEQQIHDLRYGRLALLSQEQAADLIGINQCTVGQVRRHVTWTHCP